ncbi:response regulator transcription factor [Steroidobacter sp.]|uniref:response regulator transcription factor n=1 Tax=Steroidobacter sp. TaxID=1978227 RepID=UPI0025FFF17F|nr:response regulator transcription factor [Steroidobacter sp.]
MLIADDDADLLALLEYSLSEAGYDVLTAADGAAAIAAFEKEDPDFALLDVNMPAFDGLQVCREIRRRSMIPVMMLTARNMEEDLVAALDSGADDFLSKPFSPRILLARIRALARRSENRPADLVESGNVRFDPAQRTVQIGAAEPVRLTALELRVVELFLTHPGRTVVTDQLTRHLWGRATGHERRTLKQLIYRLRHKLEADPSAPQTLLTTPGAGYRFVVDTGA